jgi:hypothetical protein
MPAATEVPEEGPTEGLGAEDGSSEGHVSMPDAIDLRVPVPKPETLRKIIDLLAALRNG